VTSPDPEILEVFRVEATERLDRMVETLLAVESGQAAPDAIDSLFRDAHSIKGSAGMVGIEGVRAIAHTIEDVLEEARQSGSLSRELTEPMLRATDQLRRAVEGEPESAAAPVAATLEQRSMRVSTEKVDRLFDIVGETVLHNRRLERLLDDGDHAGRDAEHVEEELGNGTALMDELQYSALQMRTLPLSSITGSFARAVRDIAAAQGKQVDLQIRGAETQLDRTILEGISEPISHLLSNAVAHGIEPTAERERAGKPARGHIELRAEQRGSRVAIEVLDDGRGVASELIRRQEGPGTLAELLAEPGFSTAEEVTDVSGRGVGLDAVMSHVESLSGELGVSSEPGRGTTVTMLLPLTLSLLRVLVVERGGQTFGLPLTSIDEAIAVSDRMSLGGRSAIEVRGRSIPLVDLADLLDTTAPELPAEPHAMVVAASGHRVAVLCDRIVEEQEVVVKSLGPLLDDLAGYLGAAMMHDGRIALVLDPAYVTKTRARKHTGITTEVEEQPPTILVVDDQFTVRELQRGILEAAGFRVKTARDGGEALDAVAGAPEVELVVTDVRMPGMDGIELLRAIRGRHKGSSLPVVVVTSQGSDEDRQRGLEAGADAYIVKDQFDQKTLIETVERLLTRGPA
jgi:two-component system, chemotaxis family, sensor kinase CheA